MKTRDQLEKMTKKEIIDMITDSKNELVERPSILRGLTFGTLSFVEDVIQYLVTIKLSNSVAWKAAKRLLDVSWDDAGNVTVTFYDLKNLFTVLEREGII